MMPQPASRAAAPLGGVAVDNRSADGPGLRRAGPASRRLTPVPCPRGIAVIFCRFPSVDHNPTRRPITSTTRPDIRPRHPGRSATSGLRSSGRRPSDRSLSHPKRAVPGARVPVDLASSDRNRPSRRHLVTHFVTDRWTYRTFRAGAAIERPRICPDSGPYCPGSGGRI
jgi:hypothetical protein